ncbi:MAG: hypothetical protein LBJ74_02275 [Heliobacteriaceae bacterium]|jgi:hypothetical protein|nr:hypothetical protein [Heliobacteriaceae bacterium]
MAKFSLKGICESLGKNNKPTYVVMAIALVKGICRPIFTMMDKKEDPETKKYTAIREGLTEVIAIPTYFLCGEAASKLSSMMPQNLQKRADKNLMFVGVCAAALIVIPGLCSLAIKPLMKKIQENNTKKKPLEPPVNHQLSTINHQPLNNYSTFKPFNGSYGLKVGGV